MEPERDKPLIGIVGVCASGKTSLISKLNALGYSCRHIAQEHSYVKTMWKQLTNPDILVYLHVSYPETIKRRNLNWTQTEYDEQLNRISNAKEYADIIIETDSLTSEEVVNETVTKLESLLASK
jgi:uridine kinase